MAKQMMYRDDHDAALARIDVLERATAQLLRDNGRLAGENADLRARPRVTEPAPRTKPAAPEPITLPQAVLVGLYTLVFVAMLAMLAS